MDDDVQKLQDLSNRQQAELAKHKRIQEEIKELESRSVKDAGVDERLDNLKRAEEGTVSRAVELRAQWQQVAKRVSAASDPAGDENGFAGPPGPQPWSGSASGLLAKSEDWAPAVVKSLKAAGRGLKAITSGTVGIPTVLAGYVATPNAPRRVSDLLVNRRGIGTNEFAYLQQSARTNNASPVADGGTKPTSVFTLEQITDRVRVIAHLSEPIPNRLFEDEPELQRFLSAEMQEGLLQALEAEVMTGDGTGEHLTGILETSGVLAIAFTTDLFTTLRQARLELEQVNEVPTAWVFNPADAATIDLTREETDGQFLIGDAATNILGNLPRVSSPLVPAGSAILGDFAQTQLFVRQDATLDADASGSLFDTNRLKVRCEGRFGFAVLRPQAFAVVDLTAV